MKINTTLILLVPMQHSVHLLIASVIVSSAWLTASAQEASPIINGVSGDLELGLDARDTEFDRDFELEQVLRLRIDPPENDRLRFRTTLWAIEDLDGRENASSALSGLNDSEDSTVDTRILSLYMELDGEKDNSRIRLGRQRIRESLAYNRIDGGYLALDRKYWSFYSFFGARASVYDSHNHDVSSGGGIAWRLARATRLSLDLFHGDDERRRFGGGDIESTLTSLSLRHAFNARHSVFARGTWHESNLDELRVAVQGVLNESEIVYSLNYRRRISTLSERPTDFPGFYQVIGELNGYDDVQGILNIPMTKRVATGLEIQVHEAESTALGSANRDFTRYGISLDVDNIATHYNGRIILEFWDASEGESEKTISGEVSREWEKAEATVGVDYDRFQDRIIQFDPLSLTNFVIESRDDLYSLFASHRYTFNDQHSSRVRVSVEDDDSDDAPYWRLHASHTIRF